MQTKQLTEADIGKFYFDAAGNELLITLHEIPCCSIERFHANLLGTNNVFVYDCFGRRLTHYLKLDMDKQKWLILNTEKETNAS